LAPDLLVQDATVPRTRLPEVLARIGEIAERYELQVANVFHAGDGNLHPNLVYDRRDPEETRRVEEASMEIMAACVAVGGTITGEHGVGSDKRKYMPLVFSPVELEALDGIRQVFDPQGTCNPGKVLPERLAEEGPGRSPP
jgi:FAD/FMN-containing dehydrogenase